MTIELSRAELHAVAGYAAVCAREALPIFEAECPEDPRPRTAIEGRSRTVPSELKRSEIARGLRSGQLRKAGTPDWLLQAKPHALLWPRQARRFFTRSRKRRRSNIFSGRPPMRRERLSFPLATIQMWVRPMWRKRGCSISQCAGGAALLGSQARQRRFRVGEDATEHPRRPMPGATRIPAKGGWRRLAPGLGASCS
ncbi:putative immunity protein [Pseudaminobacter soli (ex Li et al. 2025)]|uniref:putative immunity protein n=1 Tax=Pseudaminobacter soli (ex Li et al. 2025) TaxID=1295366 RepID=UPI003CD04A85